MKAGVVIRGRGGEGFHGFMIAKKIEERGDARMLTAHGTLYKALSRMEEAGLLDSGWEDPLIATFVTNISSSANIGNIRFGQTA